MTRLLLRSKIHRATITHADLHYEGSVTIDEALMDAAGLIEHEAVHVWNVTRGTRLTTYALAGARDSGVICINGAAAHLNRPKDIVILAAFAQVPETELKGFAPKVVFVDEKNRLRHIGPETPGPEPVPKRRLASASTGRVAHRSVRPWVETERLILRQLEAGDFEAFAEISADPEVMRYISDGKPLDAAAAFRALATMIGHWELRSYGQWALVEKKSGQLIGRAGLWNPEGWPGLEVGWLLRKSHWGQGFATEAARATVNEAFERLEVERLISVIQPNNARSIRVAERLGEAFERKLVVAGQEVLIYGINRPENSAR